MNVTCNKCGWVYFQVSKAYIDNWEAEWKVYWPTLDERGREVFALPDGPPGKQQYLSCQCGNSYKNFRDSEPTDCPDGCTINAIMDRNEV